MVSQVETDHNLNVQTIEGLQEADLIAPIIITAPPPKVKEIIGAAITKAKQAGKKAADNYRMHIVNLADIVVLPMQLHTKSQTHWCSIC
ncbi:hypothetical protein [Candidatus Parabeggiatoa sp. HSG14]|uniref:hypothetical protein n=1 Tax=Candidatus Parabeggiatoa sp. HSG14 TaxID=3055593 RepID=UPI0025A865A7|nr:hypothetical protein [Thiotrichales bacterium HSG14]